MRLDGVTRRFGAHRAVDGVSLDVKDGEFIAVLGPSGCGKTTLLRLVAGFDPVDEGEIRIGDALVSGGGKHLPPEERRVGIVFQSYALWPHMPVSENVAYALKVQKIAREAREKRVAAALATVGLTELSERKPAMLSGGQRQRVALARCLAMEPALVLLDEPLANLDVHLRASMEEEFADFHKRTGTTMFYITHDQAEAMALADRIAVMDKGRLLQVAEPATLYRQPADATVARFIGEGVVLPCDVREARDGRAIADIFGVEAAARCRPEQASGVAAQLALHASDFAIARRSEEGIAATLRRLVYLGGRYRGEAVLDARPGETVTIDLPDPATVAEGEAIRLAIRDGWILPA
jgi:iron(III) transport system ATP-binding protein